PVLVGSEPRGPKAQSGTDRGTHERETGKTARRKCALCGLRGTAVGSCPTLKIPADDPTIVLSRGATSPGQSEQSESGDPGPANEGQGDHQHGYGEDTQLVEGNGCPQQQHGDQKQQPVILRF